jgi:hypothetical protein
MKGTGTTSFQLDFGNSLKMSDVLYVPGLKRNIVSTSALEDKGYRVAFIDGKVLIWHKTSSLDSTSVIGVRYEGLYVDVCSFVRHRWCPPGWLRMGDGSSLSLGIQ